jgi:hypothetical protein
VSPSGNQRFGFVVVVVVAAALGGCAGGESAGTETDHGSSPETDTGWQDGRSGLELPEAGGVETGWEVLPSDGLGWCAEPNGFGCTCTSNTDCSSGWCVFHLGEKVCSQTCVEDCPPGWVCEETSVAGADPIFLCKSPYPSLCLPCESSDGCVKQAEPARKRGASPPSLPLVAAPSVQARGSAVTPQQLTLRSY